ncbi:MAG: hydrogenase maturation protease [Ignavibacteria bacterium]
MRQLFIGIGNEFRCDDAVGLLIARKLKDLYPDLEIIESDGNGLDLISNLLNYEKVIFIDAAIAEKPEESGQTKIIKITPDTRLPDIRIFSSHSFSLIEALKMSKELNFLPDEIYLYLIYSMNFSFGQEISDEVKKASEKILEAIINSHILGS